MILMKIPRLCLFHTVDHHQNHLGEAVILSTSRPRYNTVSGSQITDRVS